MFIVLLQIFGLFCGVLARTLLPFFRKLSEGKIKNFKIKFFYQAIGSFILSIIFLFLIFPQYPIQTQIKNGLLTIFKLFCIAFTFGFGFNSIINEIGEWFSNGNKK